MLNAIFLALVLSVALHHSRAVLQHSVKIGLCFFVGVMILLIQRLYVYGLRRADPFISAMTLCTIVPLSLGIESIFEHRRVGLAEIALATGYVVSNAVSVKMSA
jgi:drug/metabolite transporter (DMT)-like permease